MLNRSTLIYIAAAQVTLQDPADYVGLSDSVEIQVFRASEASDALLLPDSAEIMLRRSIEMADLLILPDADERVVERWFDNDADRLTDLRDSVEEAAVRFAEGADFTWVMDAVDPPGEGLDRAEVWIERRRADADDALAIPDTVEAFLEQFGPQPEPEAPAGPPVRGVGVVVPGAKPRRRTEEEELMELIVAGIV